MTDQDTIEYHATVDDPKMFAKPWAIRLEFQRRTDRDRLFEYVCQAEVEEVSGTFTREDPCIRLLVWIYEGIEPPSPIPQEMESLLMKAIELTACSESPSPSSLKVKACSVQSSLQNALW